ncbi:MAG: transposase [Blastocatellales bacterium]|nr:transposase [Blastocatellales bacterium]
MITQELWMDLKLLSRQGMSIRAIARATGLSRNTVRRALAAKTPPDYKPRRAKPQKIAPYLDYLQAQLEQRPWVSAAQIYREISPQGYGGCYELVKVQCRSLRQQQQAARRACVGFETAPAQEAQFDWTGVGLLALSNHPSGHTPNPARGAGGFDGRAGDSGRSAATSGL